MRGAAPDVPATCPALAWELLFRQTLRFAEYQIERLRWRGNYGGVLPEGFDANSLAAQAFFEVLHERKDGSHVSLEVSDQLLWELKRRVLRHVTRLHHLKENWIVSNEADLARVQDMDGEPISPLELIPAPDVRPDDALLRAESEFQVEKLKSRFEAFLAKERRLTHLFELTWDGTIKPKPLAAQLKLGVRTVENLQKRLQRNWSAFLGTRK